MRRKRREFAVEVPPELATFVPADWSDDLDTAVERWRIARRDWFREHGHQLDGVWFIRTTLFEIHRARGRDWPEPGRRHR